MSVNITGINDLSEDVRLLQTDLAFLTDVVENIPSNYVNLTVVNDLTDNFNTYTVNNTSSISTINLAIDEINNNYVNHTALSILSTAIDDQFATTTTYIDEKIAEQHEYTDQEIEALRNEGYIQEAITQVLAWATSDEGKRFRKKIWTRISSLWSGKQAYTELLDDVDHAISDELDDLLKVYRYQLNNAGIRSDPFLGKDIVMQGDTYIYKSH